MDLAYIRILASGYSDDADPEYEGLAIDILYCDSKSEDISFRGVSVTVHVEVFGYRSVLDTFDHEKMELVYETTVTVDHSMSLDEMFGKYIRIPFVDVRTDRNKYYEYGTVKATVTASGRDYSDFSDLAPLYVPE